MFKQALDFAGVKGQIALKPPYLLGLLLCFLQQSALADIWGFVDERGVTHVASEQVDPRYELFSRGQDTSAPVAPPMPERVLQAQPLPPLSAEPAASVLGVSAFFERSPAYRQVQQQVREASAQHDIEHELLQALIATESGFDASAVSPKGAVGLMQVLPATAARFGVMADRTSSIEKKLTDPRINLAAGSRYLRYLFSLFPGQLELALASYNAGEGAVQRAGNAIPNILETKNYVKTVIQVYRMLKPAAPVASAPLPPPEAPRPLAPITPEIIRGGALNRGNMMPSLTLPLPQLTSPATPSP